MRLRRELSRTLSRTMNADFQDFKHTELTEKVIKIFYNVYNKPGCGFLEKIYENVLMIELRKEGIEVLIMKKIICVYQRKSAA